MTVRKKISMLALMTISIVNGCANLSGEHGNKLQQAQIAFAAKDYRTSLHLLTPLAKAGNPEAAYALGYLYFNGLGTNRDLVVGKIWIRKAALKNYKPAIKALTEINETTNRISSNVTTPNTKHSVKNRIISIKDSLNDDAKTLTTPSTIATPDKKKNILIKVKPESNNS